MTSSTSFTPGQLLIVLPLRLSNSELSRLVERLIEFGKKYNDIFEVQEKKTTVSESKAVIPIKYHWNQAANDYKGNYKESLSYLMGVQDFVHWLYYSRDAKIIVKAYGVIEFSGPVHDVLKTYKGGHRLLSHILLKPIYFNLLDIMEEKINQVYHDVTFTRANIPYAVSIGKERRELIIDAFKDYRLRTEEFLKDLSILNLSSLQQCMIRLEVYEKRFDVLCSCEELVKEKYILIDEFCALRANTKSVIHQFDEANRNRVHEELAQIMDYLDESLRY